MEKNFREVKDYNSSELSNKQNKLIHFLFATLFLQKNYVVNKLTCSTKSTTDINCFKSSSIQWLNESKLNSSQSSMLSLLELITNYTSPTSLVQIDAYMNSLCTNIVTILDGDNLSSFNYSQLMIQEIVSKLYLQGEEFSKENRAEIEKFNESLDIAEKNLIQLSEIFYRYISLLPRILSNAHPGYIRYIHYEYCNFLERLENSYSELELLPDYLLLVKLALKIIARPSDDEEMDYQLFNELKRILMDNDCEFDETMFNSIFQELEAKFSKYSTVKNETI